MNKACKTDGVCKIYICVQEGAGIPLAGDSHEGQLGGLDADRRLEPDAAGEGAGRGARSSGSLTLFLVN